MVVQLIDFIKVVKRIKYDKGDIRVSGQKGLDGVLGGRTRRTEKRYRERLYRRCVSPVI